MGLRNINLKQVYRSDRDDIVHEFFIRCLSNSARYDRSIEHASVKSLITLALGSDSETDTRLRIVTGNRYSASDISTLGRMFSPKKPNRRKPNHQDNRFEILERMIRNSQLEIKVAIPVSDEISGAFTERVGIFTDTGGDRVAFTGTSNQTFDSQNHDFESIDVFTSWEDPSRVQTKADDFERLWENKTRYLSVSDFASAESENRLKYSSSWAIGLE